MPIRRESCTVPSERVPQSLSPEAPLPRPRAAISARQDAMSAVTSAPQSSSADPPTKKTAVDFATTATMLISRTRTIEASHNPAVALSSDLSPTCLGHVSD